ncbi:MAG: elongation factor Ts [Candidatus Parcubacteria bacterium]|jgi:elongation factor Ts
MAVDSKMVAELRAMTGAGMVDCKKALDEAEGDMTKAAELLRKKGIAKAGSKGDRAATEGLVYSYIHGEGRIGVLVEVACETDFVARTEQFKEFVHEIGLQISAMNPLYVSREQIAPEAVEKEKELSMADMAGSAKPAEVMAKITEGRLEKWYSEVCLLDQAFIKDEDKTVGELLKETIAKTGENIQVKRFVRYALGA